MLAYGFSGPGEGMRNEALVELLTRRRESAQGPLRLMPVIVFL